MISAVFGENSFVRHSVVAEIVAAFDGQPERIDAEQLTVAALPDLFMGSTLFASSRLVLVYETSQNSDVWSRLPEWLPRIDDSIHVVFIDTKPDKRTAAYKAIIAAASVHTAEPLTSRDRQQVIGWLQQYATQQGTPLDKSVATKLVDKAGIDQWALASALEKLAFLPTITAASIDTYIDALPSENIFELLQYALDGDHHAVRSAVQTLRLTEEPRAVFGLLSSQIIQLMAIASASDGQPVAKDFGIHPFVVSKLQRHVRRRGQKGIADIVRLAAKTDTDLKRTSLEPWVLIESFLYQLAPQKTPPAR